MAASAPSPAAVAGSEYDVIVIGAGPGGSTAALRAARHGLDVLVLEQAAHPRFHIGESFLPRVFTLLRDLGLTDGLEEVPQTYKIGGSFVLGHEQEPTDFHFANALVPANHETLNVERAPFDAFLCRKAREAGATILEGVKVQRILELGHDAVAVELHVPGEATRVVRGRCLFDASGQGTVVGRHLGTRRTLPDLEKVAYYGHFSQVWRPAGVKAGYPQIVMCDEGWFWFIPIDPQRTSVGLVMDAALARRVGLPPKQMLFWGLERCPVARRWTEGAVFPAETWITADFSYTCAPYAGPGYFLVGDAATFVDPIFSTGVTLGMMTGVHAADLYHDMRLGRLAPRQARRRYHAYVRDSSSAFFRFVRGYYRHAFREVFLSTIGPLKVHRAVTSVLAGDVFPRPHRSVRWRLLLFELVVALQRHLPLVRRRERFSLLAGDVVP